MRPIRGLCYLMNCLKMGLGSTTPGMKSRLVLKRSSSWIPKIHCLDLILRDLLAVAGSPPGLLLPPDDRYSLRHLRFAQQENRMSILIGLPDWTRDRSRPAYFGQGETKTKRLISSSEKGCHRQPSFPQQAPFQTRDSQFKPKCWLSMLFRSCAVTKPETARTSLRVLAFDLKLMGHFQPLKPPVLRRLIREIQVSGFVSRP